MRTLFSIHFSPRKRVVRSPLTNRWRKQRSKCLMLTYLAALFEEDLYMFFLRCGALVDPGKHVSQVAQGVV